MFNLSLKSILPQLGDLWIFPKEQRGPQFDLIIEIIERIDSDNWLAKVIMDDYKSWERGDKFSFNKNHNKLYLLEKNGRRYFSRKHRKCEKCWV